MEGELTMVKKLISYVDYDGNQVEEEFFFNLSSADVADLDFLYEKNGGLKEYLISMIRDKDPDEISKKDIWDFLKVVIGKAVGKKNGKYFIKNEETYNDLFYTNALSSLLEDLFKTSDDLLEFVENIFPSVSEEDKNKAREELQKEGVKVV